MKLLLDENLPIKLKNSFSIKHKVLTVRDQGWSGKKNGELLKSMIKEGFEALVTLDKNLKFQQNIKNFDIKIFILNSPDSKLSTLKSYVKKLEIALLTQVENNIIEINI